MPSEASEKFSVVSFNLDDENFSKRYLFVKQHEGKCDIKPSDRTLFLTNVPQFINIKSLKYMYRGCGEIDRVYVHSKPKSSGEQNSPVDSFSIQELTMGHKVAYIVFKNSKGLEKALKCKELPPPSLKKIASVIGMKKWAIEYNSNFINAVNVQKEIEAYMSDNERKIEEEKRMAKEMDGVEDEEGWITITKHSKQPKISRSEAVSKKIINKQNRENAKKNLLNFYKCQLRESKMDHILELQKKFEKDKERIVQMKANRKFKPF